jgi:hypothetical protein
MEAVDGLSQFSTLNDAGGWMWLMKAKIKQRPREIQWWRMWKGRGAQHDKMRNRTAEYVTGSMNIKCYYVPYPTITYPIMFTVIYLTASCSLRSC